jgi:hypothetical protein
VIAATIIITAVTCGAGASAAVEEGTELAVMDGAGAAGDAVEAAAEAAQNGAQNVVQDGVSFGQKLINFFKAVNEYNPLSKLSSGTNMSILAGTEAIGSTNFGSDLATSAFQYVKDTKSQHILEEVLSTIITVLNTLVGLGAGTGSASSSIDSLTENDSLFARLANQLKGTTGLFQITNGLQLGGGAMQFSGNVGSAVAYGEQASLTAEQGVTSAMLALFQQLLAISNQQSASNSKSNAEQLRAVGGEVANTAQGWVAPGQAINSVLA